jgi:hypothetical protein
VRAQHDYPRLMIARPQAHDDVKAAQFRHLDIEDNNLRSMLATEMKGFQAIDGLAHDSDTADFQ